MIARSRNAGVIFVLAIIAATISPALAPRKKQSSARPIDLQMIVPKQFGDWRVDTDLKMDVVDADNLRTLDRIYNQSVVRTYFNTKNLHRVMLSISYGTDQRADLAVHYPEACYSAQGFRIISTNDVSVPTRLGLLRVRRLETELEGRRFEPLTYWMKVGDVSSLGGLSKRLVELQYTLSGVIPDGLLFRISSLGRDSSAEFERQDDFIRALLRTIPLSDATKLTGNITP